MFTSYTQTTQVYYVMISHNKTKFKKAQTEHVITENKQVYASKLLRVSFELQTGRSALKTSLQLI